MYAELVEQHAELPEVYGEQDEEYAELGRGGGVCRAGWVVC